MYDLELRKWGSTTSEGKDLRDVAFANYFPATFGINFELSPTSQVADYEHIEAVSVGVGATYMLHLSKESVESCPEKYEIFAAIRTWENARAANAFPGWVKKELADPSQNFHLEEVDENNWNLFKLKAGGSDKQLVVGLTRVRAYPVRERKWRN